MGKSLLSYHISMSLAVGAPVLGRFPTSRARVLYFDEENGRQDFDAYMRWVWYGLGCPPVGPLQHNLRIEHFSLGDNQWMHTLQRIAREHKPDLFVIDTATPACNIIDENSNAEATTAIKHLRHVQSECGAAALVIKHAKVDYQGTADQHHRTLRGAKAWAGACDGILFHVAAPGSPRKDGLRPSTIEPAKVRAFGLRAPLHIAPQWVGIEPKRGLLLNVA